MPLLAGAFFFKINHLIVNFEFAWSSIDMSPSFLVSEPKKSVGLAILLTFMFGPIGLFYATVSGALVMLLLPVLLLIVFFLGVFQENYFLLGWSGVLLLILIFTEWLICIIWAVISVLGHNRDLERRAQEAFNLWQRSQSASPPVVVNIHSDKPANPPLTTTSTSTPPPLPEWMRANPGKSINEYYSKFKL